jgi:hypothetical protein
LFVHIAQHRFDGFCVFINIKDRPLAKVVKAMNNSCSCAIPGDTTLRLFLERCAEETVDEEQVQRVLQPVLRMIEEGRFKRRKRAVQPAKPLAVAAVIVLTTVGIIRFGGRREALTDIAPPQVPLANVTAAMTVTGRLMGEGSPLGGITLTLLTADGEIAGTAVTDEDGGYCFTGIPDGEYQISAAMVSGFALKDEETTVAVTGSRDSRKDIELWVYETAN